MKALGGFVLLIALLVLQLPSHVAAGLFKMDFGELENFNNDVDLEDWDVFETFFLDDFDDGIARFPITDWSGEGDDDVVLTIFDNIELSEELFAEAIGMTSNNPVPQGLDVIYDGVEIPAVVKDDYLYRNPDTAGTELFFRFDNLDPGDYNLTLFLGRTSDANGQFAKVWVDSNMDPVGEPDEENTGNFAGLDPDTGDTNPEGFPVTIPLTIQPGDFLWYAHLEDNSGGISGIVIRQTGGGGLPGDFDGNGVLDSSDIDALSEAVRANSNDAGFDVNGDGTVDDGDRTFWIKDLRKTWVGDANLDGVFNTVDFLAVFQIGEYEDAIAGNSTWAEGDWTGDGDFNSGDFLAAFQDGGFEQGPRAAVRAVPEPSGLLTLAWLIFLPRIARKRTVIHRAS